MDLSGPGWERARDTHRFLCEEWPEHVWHKRVWLVEDPEGWVVFTCSCGDTFYVHADVARDRGIAKSAMVETARRKSMLRRKRIFVTAMATFSMVALFAGIALAQAASGGGGSPFDFLLPIYEALTGGHYAYAGCMAMVVLVALVKRGWDAPWMHTDLGGAAMIVAGTMAATLAAAMGAPGAHLSWAMAYAALGTAVSAAGGYSLLKRLAAPALAWVEKKWPWMEKINDLVTWLWEHRQPAQPQQPQGGAS